MKDFHPTLFHMPHRISTCGRGDCETAWWVFSPEFNWMMQMEPDLAAKYQAQGALVMLAEDKPESALEAYLSGKTVKSFSEPEPDRPPYLESEIVWYFNASQVRPEVYDKYWQQIRTWLADTSRFPRPEDVAEQLSRRIGRWGGGFDLETWSMEGPR